MCFQIVFLVDFILSCCIAALRLATTRDLNLRLSQTQELSWIISWCFIFIGVIWSFLSHHLHEIKWCALLFFLDYNHVTPLSKFIYFKLCRVGENRLCKQHISRWNSIGRSQFQRNGWKLKPFHWEKSWFQRFRDTAWKHKLQPTESTTTNNHTVQVPCQVFQHFESILLIFEIMWGYIETI